MTEIITRAAAAKNGEKLYFTGEPCKNGHTAKRIVRNWTCHACENKAHLLRAASKRKLNAKPKSLVCVSVIGNGKPWLTAGSSDADYYRARYTCDKEFQLKERLRRQMNKRRKRDGVAELVRSALCRNGNSGRAEHLLGYTMADLRQHIERQFTGGMTWDEFMAGRIHIDHITPQSAFDMSDAEQWRKCWCLSNLRPMWAQANKAKSNKIEVLL